MPDWHPRGWIPGCDKAKQGTSLTVFPVLGTGADATRCSRDFAAERRAGSRKSSLLLPSAREANA